jgi:biopolymer transport protein ExbB/TolQ
LETLGYNAVGIVYPIIWLLFVLGSIVGIVLFLLAAWRMMRAHEEIARHLKTIADRSGNG